MLQTVEMFWERKIETRGLSKVFSLSSCPVPGGIGSSAAALVPSTTNRAPARLRLQKVDGWPGTEMTHCFCCHLVCQEWIFLWEVVCAFVWPLSERNRTFMSIVHPQSKVMKSKKIQETPSSTLKNACAAPFCLFESTTSTGLVFPASLGQLDGLLVAHPHRVETLAVVHHLSVLV